MFLFERNEPEEPSALRDIQKTAAKETTRATDRGAQFNAAHAQLLEKLRPIAFADTCRFLTIQSLQFQEIWPKNSLKST